jgi:hypothetical protein
MLEFRVRYAILLTLCDEMGWKEEGGVRKKRKKANLLNLYMSLTVRAPYPRRHHHHHHVLFQPRTVWKKIVKGGVSVTSIYLEGMKHEVGGWYVRVTGIPELMTP